MDLFLLLCRAPHYSKGYRSVTQAGDRNPEIPSDSNKWENLKQISMSEKLHVPCTYSSPLSQLQHGFYWQSAGEAVPTTPSTGRAAVR